MSLHPPQNLDPHLPKQTGEAALQGEILAEQAASLAAAGHKVEETLARLEKSEGARDALLRAAADAVWSFLVQRELLGFRDRDAVIAHYRIPQEVLLRLGERH